MTPTGIFFVGLIPTVLCLLFLVLTIWEFVKMEPKTGEDE